MWFIWLLVAFVFLFVGFSKNIFLFKFLAGLLLIISGTVILSEGVSYKVSEVESFNYVCLSCVPYVERNSTFYNASSGNSSIQVSSVSTIDIFSYLDRFSLIGLGLGAMLILIGVGISIKSSVDELKDRKERRKKGSLWIGGDSD